MNYEIIDSNEYYFELIASENGEIQSEWGMDIEDHFHEKGFKFAKAFDLEEVCGSPEVEANYEARVEGLTEWGFDTDGLSYVVIVNEATYNEIYEIVNDLYLRKTGQID
jgi:hypothetical protein